MSATEARPAGGGTSAGAAPQGGPALITGRASYVDDINLAGQLWMAFVRSPEAHAKHRLDRHVGRRGAPDDVTAVFTGEDMEGVGALPMAWVPPGVEVRHARALAAGQGRGQPRRRPRRGRHRRRQVRGRRRRRGRARRVRAAAGRRRPRGGAQGRGPRPRVARAPTRPTSGRWAAATSRPASPRPTSSSSGASSTTAPSGAAIEPRGVLAEYRAGQLTVWSSTQVPHFAAPVPGAACSASARTTSASSPPRSAAASAPSCRSTPRRSSAAWASRKLERPVKWIETRSEAHDRSPTTGATRSTTSGWAPSATARSPRCTRRSSPTSARTTCCSRR